MIVVDTSGLIAALDVSDPRHAEARAALEADAGPYVLSPFVLAEMDYMLDRAGGAAALGFLLEVARGAYQLEPMSANDVGQAARIIDRYRDLRIGLADASVVLIAARVGTRQILTLDERHFRAIHPLTGGHFTLRPGDREGAT